MGDRPNILWYCTDQQRFDTIGALHNPHIQTPHLDAFMRESVTFNHAYSQSPICTPSRASFLTGRYPSICHGRENGQREFPREEVLVTRLLADQGWDCGLAGKLHLSACAEISEKEHRPNDGYRNFWWSHHPQPDWDDSDYKLWLEHEQHTTWAEHYHIPPDSRHAYPGMPSELHQTTWCTEMTLRHMSEQRHGPWLMSVNPFDPHHAFDPPAEYLARYNPDGLPLPTWLEDEWESKSPWQVIDHRGSYGGQGMNVERLGERKLREIVAAYYAMISLVDDQFGRLLNYLEDTGQREDTIVIFMSDHGEMLGDHGILLKGPHFYDCAVRVPLIMSWPGEWQQGVVTEAMVELLDIAPTLLESCGQPHEVRMQGCSLSGVLKGETNEHREDVYADYQNAMPAHAKSPYGNPFSTMLRTKTHKVVVHHGVDAGELYDLEADPGESHNLWHSPEHRELKAQMVLRCFDRSVFTADPWPERIARF